MDPVHESFSLSLNSTSDISCQTERYHESMEHLDYEETLGAARDGDYRPHHVFSCTDTAHAVHVQLTGQIRHIPFPRYRSCRHSFPNSSVVVCSAASQYNVLPKNFSICASLLLSTSIGLIISTSLFSFLFSRLASLASSRSLSWTPFSTFVDNPSTDPWSYVDYFYFFLSSPCKMGGKATKPKTVTVTETSGFKDQDRSWSIYAKSLP
jgi:hypothetical protein